MRKRLMELIAESAIKGDYTYIPDVVDHLLANGVTINEWISVEERLPEHCGMPILMVAVNPYDQIRVVKGFTDYQCPITFHTNEREYDGVWGAWDVTHWMPLPEPPKMRKEDEGK